jgi:hypothetical protein
MIFLSHILQAFVPETGLLESRVQSEHNEENDNNLDCREQGDSPPPVSLFL